MKSKSGAPVWTAVALAMVLPQGGHAADSGAVSKPGRYSGYAPVLYDGFQRTSQYVAMRDGTKIAIDIYRPTLKGALVTDKLPVVWSNNPYNRRGNNSGQGAMELVKYGYIVVSADMRGNYASFGKAMADPEAASGGNRNEWMPWAWWDAYDMTEWLAAQPWSDGKIGMAGCSAVGASQWQAAATAPPHLKAIFPMDAPSEYYDWNGITPTLDSVPPPPGPAGKIPDHDSKAVPVDEDHDGSLLQAAKEDHKADLEPGYVPYRDSVSPGLKAAGYGDLRYHLVVNTFQHFAELNKSRIPAYETTNYGEDMRAKLGVIVKLHNIKNPLKLVIGPGNHCNWSSDDRKNPSNDFNITAEQVRWYDYWLKGIKNGVLNEPKVYYYTYNDPTNDGWKFAWQWPLPTQKSVNYYLAPAADTSAGTKRAALSTKAPTLASASDNYTVDYTATTANRDTTGMTYTTAPLTADTNETGHPIVHLWVSSTATDGDFLAFLADVGPDGKVTPIPGTEDGKVRASVRALNNAPYDNLGLPYHRAFTQDAKPLTPGKPVELTFDMAPLSYVFKAGHSIRLAIICEENPRHGSARATPVLSPAPVVSFYRDRAHPSYIAMPAQAPVPATVKFEADKGATTALVSFPKTLDRRYVQDIKPGSIKVNGVPAKSVQSSPTGLVIALAQGALKPGQVVTVKGEFGNKYDYGDWTAFSGSAAVPK